MADDRAIFQDERGRGWLVEVLHGHPVPAERGICAARFSCPEDPGEPVRLGYLFLDDIARGDEEALVEALEESRPGQAIG
jgi:hypothetical protein